MGLPLFLAAMAALASTTSALAQQPVQTLPKVGGCPLGYDSSGNDCVPGKSGNTRGAIKKSGRSCPLGWFAFGSYSVKTSR